MIKFTCTASPQIGTKGTDSPGSSASRVRLGNSSAALTWQILVDREGGEEEVEWRCEGWGGEGGGGPGEGGGGTGGDGARGARMGDSITGAGFSGRAVAIWNNTNNKTLDKGLNNAQLAKLRKMLKKRG